MNREQRHESSTRIRVQLAAGDVVWDVRPTLPDCPRASASRVITEALGRDHNHGGISLGLYRRRRCYLTRPWDITRPNVVCFQAKSRIYFDVIHLNLEGSGE